MRARCSFCPRLYKAVQEKMCFEILFLFLREVMRLLLIFKCQAICIGAKGDFWSFGMRIPWLHDVFCNVSGWPVDGYVVSHGWPEAAVLALVCRLCPWAGFPRERDNAKLYLTSQLLALGPVKAGQKLARCTTNSYLVLRVGSRKRRPCTSSTSLGRLAVPCPLWGNESKVDVRCNLQVRHGCSITDCCLRHVFG